MSDLIDRDAFIEQERKVYCENCDMRQGMKNGKLTFCYEIGEAPCRACWLDDALGDLEDFPTATPWHRVEEEPKESGKEYAVWVSEGYAYFDKWLGDRWLISSVAPETVTHWMPIEPPQEDA